MARPVVEMRDMTFAYDGEPVLQNIDLAVMPGEHLAVVGPNGGGKTTLLKCLLGLLKPTSGLVRVFGRTPGQGPDRSKVGYVPQQAEIKPGFPITAQQAVLLGLAGSSGMGFAYSRAEKARAMAALEKVGAAEHAAKRMDALSGGQRQRVLVARALVSEPELLLFDEPTSNIDPHGKFCFYELLSELGRGITIMVVSHDLSITAAKVSSVACVNRKLIHNPKPEFTREMLTLLYGAHGHTCPMDGFIKDLSTTMFMPGILPEHADHA